MSHFINAGQTMVVQVFSYGTSEYRSTYIFMRSYLYEIWGPLVLMRPDK